MIGARACILSGLGLRFEGCQAPRGGEQKHLSTHGCQLICRFVISWLSTHGCQLPLDSLLQLMAINSSINSGCEVMSHGYQLMAINVCQLMSHGYQLIYQLMAVNSWLSTCRPWLSTHGNQLMAINSWLSFHLSTSSWRSTHSPIDSRLSSTFQLIASTRGYQLIEHLWLLKSWLSTHLSVNSWLSTHLSNLCCQSPIRVSSGSWQS